jgi:hypothetical protein
MIRRYFGQSARFQVERFDYPDEPSALEYHVVIDSTLEPQQASEALDRLCDEWLDEEVAALADRVVRYPRSSGSNQISLTTAPSLTGPRRPSSS